MFAAPTSCFLLCVVFATPGSDCFVFTRMAEAAHCRGQIMSEAHRYRTLAARSVLECVSLCRPAYNECLSIAFDADRRLCHLGNARAEQDCSNMETMPGKMRYYEMLNCGNGGVLNDAGTCSTCPNGYPDSSWNVTAADCDGYTETGIRWIKPPLAPCPFPVFCEYLKKRNKSRIILLSRKSPWDSFNRTLSEYIEGFGDLESNTWWLGLEKIHQITANKAGKLRIRFVMNYLDVAFNHKEFVVGDKSSGYALSVSDELPGKCIMNSKGAKFSAYDADNDDSASVHCAMRHGGGWWFKGDNCSLCNPFGPIISSSDGRRKWVDDEAFWSDDEGDPDLIPSELYFYFV